MSYNVLEKFQTHTAHACLISYICQAQLKQEKSEFAILVAFLKLQTLLHGDPWVHSYVLFLSCSQLRGNEIGIVSLTYWVEQEFCIKIQKIQTLTPDFPICPELSLQTNRSISQILHLLSVTFICSRLLWYQWKNEMLYKCGAFNIRLFLQSLLLPTWPAVYRHNVYSSLPLCENNILPFASQESLQFYNTGWSNK